jgi:hypothetical protein
MEADRITLAATGALLPSVNLSRANTCTSLPFGLNRDQLPHGSSRRGCVARRLSLGDDTSNKVTGPAACPPISFREIESRRRGRNANCHYQ